MGFLDDLKARAEQEVRSVSQNVEDYFRSQVKDAYVRVALAPTGNLSAVEIAAGSRGGTQGVAPSTVPAAETQNANTFSMIGGAVKSNMKYIIMAAAAGVGIWFLTRKKG